LEVSQTICSGEARELHDELDEIVDRNLLSAADVHGLGSW
jgi:hypothetical protein